MNTARITGHAARITPRIAWIALRNVLRKMHYAGRHAALRDRMQADLARLSRTAPHLMADIGFEVADTGPAGPRIWMRGALRLPVDSADIPPLPGRGA